MSENERILDDEDPGERKKHLIQDEGGEVES